MTLLTPGAAALAAERADEWQTPALVIDAARVDGNIAATLRMLGGDASRWRPHIKTAKLGWAVGRLLAHGVTTFKCATTAELAMLCERGASEVLLAFAVSGANAARASALAKRYPATRVSVLVEDAAQVPVWRGASVGVMIDIDSGQHRTGIAPADASAVAQVADAIAAAGLALDGLHWYDGHLSGYGLEQRTAIAHVGYQRLMQIADALADAGHAPLLLLTSGTATQPCAASYAPFVGGVHQSTAGTVLYNDLQSLATLAGAGYEPAAFVLSRVVSRPLPGRFTCDAGHKAVSADAGVPTCGVVGHPEWTPAAPSEEHLPIDVPQGAELPGYGETLLLVPRHVCPTVNLFDTALVVEPDGTIHVEAVTARGHEL